MTLRKTKVICTLGPAVDDEELIRKLIRAGMDAARFNFSHGDHEEHLQRLNKLNNVRDAMSRPVATILDTKGPEIRIKSFDTKSITLEAGASFTLTTREAAGNAGLVSVTYPDLHKEVGPGQEILIDDGLVALKVDRIEGQDIHCTVENGGTLSANKSINIPGVKIHLPALTEKDVSDIKFGVEHDFDFIAASFVRRAADVQAVRQVLDQFGGQDVKIIAKIENQEGVDNIDEILAAADGVMVARGDLGVEIPAARVPILQKQIIRKGLRLGKPVITATQMLDSMIENPRPTRAEITDVANAIYDGTSAIMLSGETAAGRYPVEAVKTMDAIARKTESSIDCSRVAVLPAHTHLSVTAATAHAACTTAEDIGADAILTVSQGGITAQMVSRFRPEATVVALLLDPQIQRQMALYWGLVPIMMKRAENSDELVHSAVETAQRAGLVKHGDLVVITAGVPVGVSGTTNMIRIEQVGGALVNGTGIGDGTVSGPLCVCRTPEEVPHKFRAGDVLVVPYTNNDLLPYMKEAAAVISEEISPEGHTATVGLLLHKPVIIGAVHATRRLSDGVQVSVDCARGIVQVMPH